MRFPPPTKLREATLLGDRIMRVTFPNNEPLPVLLCPHGSVTLEEGGRWLRTFPTTGFSFHAMGERQLRGQRSCEPRHGSIFIFVRAFATMMHGT